MEGIVTKLFSYPHFFSLSFSFLCVAGVILMSALWLISSTVEQSAVNRDERLQVQILHKPPESVRV